ncbi:MAG: hypothetical protein A3G76_07425 [Acidobacteria bacterium RIFCSPLOWO2_12_FULL_65_11]|nr:MAG: hypothetical protein A3G76_07425 [Acidobacteria bacterium RIFCSPLOWO2_12_FULL_65_11]
MLMRAVRHRLSRLIGAWLVCQAVTLAAAPVSLGAMPSTPDALKCMCPPGMAPGEACPMHHTPQGTRECVLTSGSSSSDAALLSMMGNLGLMPPVQTLSTTVAVVGVVTPVIALTISSPVRPESPPPRA